jgi:Bacterial Ig-like domain/Secretion system C-terminal sorting domain/PKD domain
MRNSTKLFSLSVFLLLSAFQIAIAQAPTFNSSSIQSVTGSGFDLRVNPDQNVTIYYVVTQSVTPPSATQVRNGLDETDATPDAAGSFAATLNTNTDGSISGLDSETDYHIYFIAENAVPEQSTVQTSTATTLDVTAPVLAALNPLSPADDATGVATNTTLIITFDENVSFSATSATGNEDNIRIRDGSTNTIVQTLTRGDGVIAINNNVVTITINDLAKTNTSYNVLIGNKVFSDAAGNDFAGISSNTVWDFTTTSGASITAPTIATCAGKFTALGDIVISENGNNNFNGTASTTRTLVLQLDNPAFLFQPSGVTTLVATGGDISTATIASISFTTVTINVTFKSGNVNNDQDDLTIRGLRITSDGSVATAHIIKDASSQLNIQGITNGTTHLGTINSGNPSPIPSAPTPANPKFCLNEPNFATLTANVTGTNIRWYSDATLNTLVTTGNTVTLKGNLGVDETTATAANGPVVYNFYVTQSSTGCESVPVQYTVTINPRPIADAGTTTPVCALSPINLGGTPTLSTPAGPGPYTYAWTGPGGFTSSSPNPTVNAPDPASDQTFNYSVTITNTNTGCSTAAPATRSVLVRTKAEAVDITKPSQSTFTIGEDAVALEGLPGGGVFSGVGVTTTGAGAFKFDPTIAGTTGSPFTITYSTTLTNGCSKSATKQVFVFAANDFIINLKEKYCSDEGLAGPLELTTSFKNEITGFVDFTWNGFWFPVYGYGQVSFDPNNPVIRNVYGNGVETIGVNQFFNPRNFTKPCPTCDNALIYVYLPYTSPGNTIPYGPGGVPYGGEVVTVNPIPNVSFTGLNSGLANPSNFCNVNQDFTLTANVTGGQFILVDNSDTPVPGNTNALTDPDGAGPTAVFNPLNLAPGQYKIKFELNTGKTGSNNQACVGRFEQSIRVNPLPTVDFNTAPAANQKFCYDATPVSLVANQTNNIFLNGPGVADQTGGNGIFNPTLAFQQKEAEANTTLTLPQIINIRATYTDPVTGCQNSAVRNVEVRPIPANSLTITPNTLTYCYEDNDVQLTGGQNNGRYTIDYLGVNPPITPVNITTKDGTFDPSAFFDTSVNQGGANPLSASQYRVTYITNDVDEPQCTNSKTFIFTVAPKIPVTISGITDDEIYCANDGARLLNLTPANGTLSINGGPAEVINNGPPGSPSASFSFNRPAGGNFSLVYTVATGGNCTNSDTKDVVLVASPVADFAVTARCDGDLINFNAAPNNNNKRWIWTFVDQDEEGENLQHRFPSPGSYNVKLQVEADPFPIGGGNFLTCKALTERVQVVGAIPIVAFNFTRVCEGDNTAFEITTTNNVPISQASWEFGDGDILPFGQGPQAVPGGSNSGRTSGTFARPTHQYNTLGTLNVKATGRTAPEFGACTDDETRQVAILKNLTPTPQSPYLMKEVNGSDGFWVPEDQNGNSTWEFAAPAGVTINSPDRSWITNASGIYEANDRSFMNSPCFNLTAYERPVFSIRYWSDTKPQADGAVVQFSTDGGINWSTLGGFVGDFSTGLNWYNTQGISSSPGGQSFWAWSREKDHGWSEGKHTLDGIPVNRRSQVRFRVAFASTSRGTDQVFTSEGFAFNEAKIEERNRIMLVENFTNNRVSTAAANNQQFMSFKDTSPGEVVKLQYHIGLPQGDDINSQNTADPNARAAFYGLTNNNALVPKGYLDGFSNGSFGSGSVLNTWVNNYFSLRSLVASPIQLTINNPVSPDDKSIAVSVRVKAANAVPSGRLALFIVVIEKTIGSEGYVMRKMLPTAAGTELQLPLAVNQEITITPDPWEVKNVNNPANLGIVAFVQNLDTKDVVQSVYMPNPSNLPTVITGVEKDSFSDQVDAYPNPADQELTILLPVPALKSSVITLADQLGKAVHTSSFSIGEKSKTISTRELADGIYFLRIETDGKIINQKIVIAHQE